MLFQRGEREGAGSEIKQIPKQLCQGCGDDGESSEVGAGASHLGEGGGNWWRGALKTWRNPLGKAATRAGTLPSGQYGSRARESVPLEWGEAKCQHSPLDL